MKDILALFGEMSLIVVIVSAILSVALFTKSLIEDIKYKYRRKHRFDKSPTAKCYCVDCIRYRDHGNGVHRCAYFGDRSMADNWFCYFAEPKKKGNSRNVKHRR